MKIKKVICSNVQMLQENSFWKVKKESNFFFNEVQWMARKKNAFARNYLLSKAYPLESVQDMNFFLRSIQTLTFSIRMSH